MKYKSLLLLLVLLPGCVIAPPIWSGEDIESDDLAALRQEAVSKTDLLEIMGPPVAIMRSGESLRVQGVNEWQSLDRGISVRNTEPVDTDAVFALFSESHELTRDHRVYYYYHGVSSKIAYILVVWIHEEAETDVERLWVLVNERTGMVEGFVYRDEEGHEAG